MLSFPQTRVAKFSLYPNCIKGENESLQSRKTSAIKEKNEKVEKMQNEIDIRKSSLSSLRQKYENLEGQLFHEQSEKQKLANVLKKHMNVPMMSSVDGRKAGKGGKSNKGSGNPSRSGSRSHLQMIPEHDGGSSNSLGSGSGKGGGGGGGGSGGGGGIDVDGDEKRGIRGERGGGGGRDGKERRGRDDDDHDDNGVISGRDSVRSSFNSFDAEKQTSDADSLTAIKKKVMLAKEHHLKKGVGDTIKEVGLKMSELEELAAIYDESHLDFESMSMRM